MPVDRRSFLKGAATVAAGGVAYGTPMQALAARGEEARRGAAPRAPDNGGYGPLRPTRDKTTGKPFLHLPAGFQYRLFSPTGETMSDGFKVPARSDGMAAFPGPRNTVRVVRNHEVFFSPGHVGPEDTAYDRGAGGATTTLEVSPDGRHDSWLSLNGTNGNCAGGRTPWGTWLTCEETINGPDANKSFLGTTLDLEEQHGYVFEVPADRGPGELVRPTPIRRAGRFTHEAVAIDPATGAMYQTQDDFTNPSGFFRYLPPNDPSRDGRMGDGGDLQVLSVSPDGSDQPVGLHEPFEPGTRFAAGWVDVPDDLVDPTFPTGIGNDEAAGFLMRELIDRGLAPAIFARLEGIWYGGRAMFFNSTSGGVGDDPDTGVFGEGHGQVWVYHLDRRELTLLFQSPGKDVLDLPDNLTVTPQGSLLLCEDGDGANFLRGLTLQGGIFDFARNGVPGQEDDEFAGATFSPDGTTLFVNIQASQSLTFAIWGPWERGAL
jgi:secreted PhoX family phosphatase